MDKKYNYTLPLLFALVAIASMFLGARFSATFQRDTVETGPSKKFDEVLHYVNEEYVDTPKDNKLVEGAIESMLSKLDPHSSYIPARDREEADEKLTGNFEGIGIVFNILNDTIVVETPLPGGPSEQRGIKAGDRIVKIEGKKVAGVGFKNEDVVKNLRGPHGTKVNITIYRPNEKKTIDFTVTRDVIPIYSIDASYMAAPGVGYIKINSFGAHTFEEFQTAIKKLKTQGLKSLILDLQNNPGGYLNSATDIADEFLDNNKLIVYTQGRVHPKETYTATAKGDFEKGKLVVLIDEGSASASEIVTGALQDWDRAIVIGRRSFGKGLVQQPFRLSDGSELHLTIARYYTPSGRCIQRSYAKGTESYYDDVTKRFSRGELESKDSIKLTDTLKYHTHNGRVVYGGGGITPDIFVPLDTTGNNDYMLKLYTKGVLIDFVIYYMDRNRADIAAKYKDFNAFDAGFNPDNKTMQSFENFATGHGVKDNIKEFNLSKKLIATQIKALVARQLFKSDGFYEILNEDNGTFKKALEVLQDDKDFDKMKINY